MANLPAIYEVTLCCISPNNLVVYHAVPLLGLTI